MTPTPTDVLTPLGYDPAVTLPGKPCKLPCGAYLYTVQGYPTSVNARYCAPGKRGVLLAEIKTATGVDVDLSAALAQTDEHDRLYNCRARS